MKHKVDDRVFYCMQCGKSLLDIFDDRHYECDGIEGYIHPEFVKVRLKFIQLMALSSYGKEDGKQKAK
jgi:hypothetical protein